MPKINVTSEFKACEGEAVHPKTFTVGTHETTERVAELALMEGWATEAKADPTPAPAASPDGGAEKPSSASRPAPASTGASAKPSRARGTARKK